MPVGLFSVRQEIDCLSWALQHISAQSLEWVPVCHKDPVCECGHYCTKCSRSEQRTVYTLTDGSKSYRIYFKKSLELLNQTRSDGTFGGMGTGMTVNESTYYNAEGLESAGVIDLINRRSADYSMRFDFESAVTGYADLPAELAWWRTRCPWLYCGMAARWLFIRPPDRETHHNKSAPLRVHYASQAQRAYVDHSNVGMSAMQACEGMDPTLWILYLCRVLNQPISPEVERRVLRGDVVDLHRVQRLRDTGYCFTRAAKLHLQSMEIHHPVMDKVV